MVMYQKGGDIYSSGFKVNSPFLKEGNPLMQSSYQVGGGVGVTSHFAIPAGLYGGSSNDIINKSQQYGGKVEVVNEDIYGNLLRLAELKNNSNKKQTKKRKLKDDSVVKDDTVVKDDLVESNPVKKIKQMNHKTRKILTQLKRANPTTPCFRIKWRN